MSKYNNSDSVMAYSVLPHIKLIGKSFLELNEVKSIVSYDENMLELEMSDFNLKIYGFDLAMTELNFGAINLNGKITRLELVDG